VTSVSIASSGLGPAEEVDEDYLCPICLARASRALTGSCIGIHYPRYYPVVTRCSEIRTLQGGRLCNACARRLCHCKGGGGERFV